MDPPHDWKPHVSSTAVSSPPGEPQRSLTTAASGGQRVASPIQHPVLLPKAQLGGEAEAEAKRECLVAWTALHFMGTGREVWPSLGALPREKPREIATYLWRNLSS